MTSAVTPQLIFWHRGALYNGSSSSTRDYAHVQVGQWTGSAWTWTTVRTWYSYYTPLPSDWTKVQYDLSAYVGSEIRLRFVMKDADLFALRFVKSY